MIRNAPFSYYVLCFIYFSATYINQYACSIYIIDSTNAQRPLQYRLESVESVNFATSTSYSSTKPHPSTKVAVTKFLMSTKVITKAVNVFGALFTTKRLRRMEKGHETEATISKST